MTSRSVGRGRVAAPPGPAPGGGRRAAPDPGARERGRRGRRDAGPGVPGEERRRPAASAERRDRGASPIRRVPRGRLPAGARRRRPGRLRRRGAGAHARARRRGPRADAAAAAPGRGRPRVRGGRKPRVQARPTTGLGGPDQKFFISVKSKSIRLIFGRIDCSRRVLEAQPKILRRNGRIRAH